MRDMFKIIYRTSIFCTAVVPGSSPTTLFQSIHSLVVSFCGAFTQDFPSPIDKDGYERFQNGDWLRQERGEGVKNQTVAQPTLKIVTLHSGRYGCFLQLAEK